MRSRRPRANLIASRAFTGFCVPSELAALAIRWCLRFGLSYRDVEELLAERGVEVDHTSIYRWVQRFTPLLADAARPGGGSTSTAHPSSMTRTESCSTIPLGSLSSHATAVGAVPTA
jgi:hypothetical protein